MKPQPADIHPELRALARRIPRFSFNARTLWFLRLLLGLRPPSKAPAGLVIENIFIPTPDKQAKIRLRLYRPKSSAAPVPALLWMHGGGYILGNPEVDELACVQYARELGIVVASVDYRYAPEHPFPAPLDDCYTGLKWVAAQAGTLGVDARRIAIGGESGGGGLAAALAQLAHDRNEIKVIFQTLIYPMLDDRTTTRPEVASRDFLVWNQDSNRYGWESYLQQKIGLAEAPAYAVPSRRADLAGLPPAWIGVGALDLFHDEDVAYAHRLTACGVACELCVVPGAFHGFDTVALQSQVAQTFRQSQLAALKRALSPDS